MIEALRGASHLTAPFEATLFSQTLPSSLSNQPIKCSHQKASKGGHERRKDLTQLPPPLPHLKVSSKREIAGKFEEVVETLKLDTICPYLADDVTYELLRSTFVVVLHIWWCFPNTERMMLGREEAYQPEGWVD